MQDFAAVPSEKRLLTTPESNFARDMRAKPPFFRFLQAGKIFCSAPFSKIFSYPQ
jgi:hypothetical protein